VIAESGWQASQFDKILLVGGSTRMPVVREELAKVFDQSIELAGFQPAWI
jgi:molecular chaperone DnaK (HSP70)